MRKSDYPQTTQLINPQVDVIIPFTDRDRHLVYDAIGSIAASVNVYPIIHVIADNCKSLAKEEPDCILPPKAHILLIESHEDTNHKLCFYRTYKNVGPYVITNHMVNRCHSPYLAIQDADDTSSPQRLWKQLAILDKYEMTSCAMYQQAIEGYDGVRHLKEPILLPGTKMTACPMGRCINSTRTMKKSFFIKMNGFAAIPCSGDFHFDNRCNITEQKVHYSHEVLAVRRLHPESLSSGGTYAFLTGERDKIGWKLLNDIKELKDNPTLATARAQGALTSSG